jgi:phage gp37-like protein
MYDIKAVEDAFITALEPLKTAGTIRTLETYGGQLNAESLEQVTFNYPAVFAIWLGCDVTVVNRADVTTARMSVIVCDRSLRGEAAARRGSATNPGVYALLEEVRGVLHLKRVVEGWTPPVLRREAALAYVSEGSPAVYEALYEIRARFISR